MTVMGYVQNSDAPAAGESYVPVSQAQIVDTRSGLGAPQAQVPAGGSLTVQVAGAGGVPSDAAGAAVFIGAANASVAGSVSAYPTGGSSSSLAVLSYSSSRTVHGLYYGALSPSGQLTLVNQGSAAVDLMVGVQGYLVSPASSEAGGSYQDVAEQRIIDTRYGNGGVPATPLPSGGSITFTMTGSDGIPATGVSSVAQSVGALNPTANGYLSVYPAGASDPNEPGVNFSSGDYQDNDMSAPLVSQLSNAGQETITNHSTGTVDVVVSARGYYAAAAAPDAPGQVDASLQGGTATVTWSPPDTDGGAAITSYAVTVYNSNGSVNQTGSAGPSDTSWTATGLGTGNYSASVAAVNSAGSSNTATAAVNTVPSGWSAPSTENTEIDTGFNLDLSTGNLTFADGTATDTVYAPDGSVTSTSSTPLTADDGPNSAAYSDSGSYTDPGSYPDAGMSSESAGGYQCVHNSNSRIHAHTPWNDTASGNHETVDFMHEAYTVTNARKLYGGGGAYWTFQDMVCSTGGGEPTANGYHVWFSGTAVALDRSNNDKIGAKWGKGESNSTVSTTFNFSLSAGVATIGASVGIQPGVGSYEGDIANDGKFPGWKNSWDPNQYNRVNAFFISPHRWPWDGATSFEGNTSQALYEWPMGSTGTGELRSDTLIIDFHAT